MTGLRWFLALRSIHLDQQPFEIFAFRKMQRDRVIRPGGKPPQNARIAASISGAALVAMLSTKLTS